MSDTFGHDPIQRPIVLSTAAAFVHQIQPRTTPFPAGIEARMPDDLPVFGRSAKHEGVYHQFGFSAHGFQLGPGAGAVMAEIIATGRSNVPIDGLDIARFTTAH